MMNKEVIFLVASSRRPGNTWILLEHLNASHQFKVIDLAARNISYFDYEHANIGDDFIQTVEEILQYRKIGFVSPVYWYTVSAQMKTFLDRLSDLLLARKDFGRALAGKQTFLVATGSTDNDLPQGMEDVIRLTSNYMKMEFLGSFYTKMQGDFNFGENELVRAKNFMDRIMQIQGEMR